MQGKRSLPNEVNSEMSRLIHLIVGVKKKKRCQIQSVILRIQNMRDLIDWKDKRIIGIRKDDSLCIQNQGGGNYLDDWFPPTPRNTCESLKLEK
jgi:hypothetical protein